MKKLIFLASFLLFGVFVLPAYSLTVLSGPDTDGCYVIRVEGEDILSDISIFSDLAVSRNGGESWEIIFQEANKAVKWLEAKGQRVMGLIKIPTGHYDSVRFNSHRKVWVELEYREGRPRRQVELDFEDEFEFTTEDIDMDMVKDGNMALRFDNPLVYLDLRVRWDTNINAYADPQIVDQVFEKDLTGASFSIEQIALEEEGEEEEEEEEY